MKTLKFVKSYSVMFALLLSISACKTEPSAECVTMEKKEKQLAANLKMYQVTWDKVINEGKLEEINEKNFEKNAILVTTPENIVGIEGFRAYYKNYLTGFSNIKFTIKTVFGQGDNIVKHWSFKGKHTGDFFGIAPTGKDVNVEGVTLVKMKEGKIAQEQDVIDNLELMQQLGVIPR